MGDNAKKALVDGLNGLLADHLALYLKTKNFHWHVKGREFRDLHLLFDEQATAIFANVDVIAERVRKNAANTLTSIGSVAAKTRIVDEDDTSLAPMDMVERLRDDNAALVKSLKELKELAGDAGDNATDGLIDEWTDEAEERVWFLSSVLG
ncbi:DNA starvation/stationary phase protection protein [Croceicoccus ponticola]|uniref:DNA starvation/stationary phase protection protein n=1 Tax=Croceicoccus ponticola TaxID=2217664 RepID=A0A437GXD3_9SPHN|nr:DNA starvation/stationary phase protection protein [Croceicoccus ponticola]RVQ65783.1 DNA starvation/stationary phase protection protein [Croceicoccus ponticola]